MLALFVLFCAVCPFSGRVGARSSLMEPLFVKVRPGVGMADVRSLSDHDVAGWVPVDVPGWIRIVVAGDRLDQIRTGLLRDPAVVAVEEEHHLRAALIPDDTYWPLQWGASKIHAPVAWDLTTGSAGLAMAILDSGVDVSHPDLAGQLWVNAGEVAGNGVDDDGNGKVDDVNGWRFGHDAGSVPYESSDIDDEYGHGTHVSGIAAAAGDNGQGVAGMAWGSRLMIVRVLDASGSGWYSDVAAGIIYAVDNGARIINLSLGGSEDDLLLRDAVNYAATRGVLVVSAAGNVYYGDTTVLYPAAYDAAIAVAATNSSDQRAVFSCYGPPVDLAAPGENIYSTEMGGGYHYMSGTSMATPHVSGLAALIWSHRTDLTAAQVTQVMINTSKDVNAVGWDPYTGWGRIDAGQALSTPVPLLLYLPLAAHSGELTEVWSRGE